MSTKRDNGQGSICQRKDGRWVGKIQVGTKVDGKPDVKSIYAKSEAEAKRKLKAYKNELIKNDFVQVKKTTIGNYMTSWLVNVKKNKVKPSSYDKIEYTINNLVIPNIGSIQMANLTSNDIQLFVNKLNATGYSYSTISQAYHTVNDCLKNAMVRREILYNSATGVSLPNKTQFKKDYVKFFSDEEVSKIINEAVRRHSNGVYVHRLGNAVILLLYTGMRVGELLSLKWEDVDLVNNQIIVKSTLSRIKNRNDKVSTVYSSVIQDTKSQSGMRTIPLIKQTVDAINGLLSVSVNSKFVITNKSGELIIPYSLRTVLNSVLKHCDIDTRGAHALRHTFASMLFKKGVDVKTVSEILGHSDVTITYNTYIHLIKEQKQQAVSLLELEV